MNRTMIRAVIDGADNDSHDNGEDGNLLVRTMTTMVMVMVMLMTMTTMMVTTATIMMLIIVIAITHIQTHTRTYAHVHEHTDTYWIANCTLMIIIVNVYIRRVSFLVN